MKINKIFISIFILVLLSPIGLILPELFNADTAWGEWDVADTQKQLGYVPVGMKRSEGMWNPLMPDYNFNSKNGSNIIKDSLAYVISGFAGITACFGVSMLIVRISANSES